ncbi:UNVERIFIED_CONTAM: hypothetical protein Cloal_3141 [Acetivibrio alkalicellulosi]
MNIVSVVSTKPTVDEAIKDIKNQLGDFDVKLLVFFSSSSFDLDSLSLLMQRAFEDAVVFGCSTAGEITSGDMLTKSIVAMAFNSSIIEECKIEVLENISDNPDVNNAFDSFEKYYNDNLYTMDMTKYVGIILIDGLSMMEESVMDLIGDRTNVTFIGGSAGDDLKFSKTYVFANGKAYNNAALLALLKINDTAEFGIIKTQSFEVLDHVLTASKVDEKNRQVIEFNNEPAVNAYAKAVGASSPEHISKYFMTNPVGLPIGEDDIYVRSPQSIIGNTMRFYCNILEGMEVKLLKSTNILEDTKRSIESKVKEFGSIEGIINFHCILRTLELQKENTTKQYGEIFKDIPTIGFSTYGEEYIGHINQTSTMLVFKSKKT